MSHVNPKVAFMLYFSAKRDHLEENNKIYCKLMTLEMYEFLAVRLMRLWSMMLLGTGTGPPDV